MENTTNLGIVEYSWHYNQFNLDLVRDQNIEQLIYRKIDTKNPDSPPIERPAGLHGKTISQKIESLKKCHVVIDGGNIHFLNSIREWNLKEFSPQSGNLSLLQGKNSLLWHLAFPTERIDRTMPFSKAIVLSKRCSPYVRNIIEMISASDDENKKETTLRGILINEFTVHRFMSKEVIELELTENAKKRELKIRNDPELAKLYDLNRAISYEVASAAKEATSAFLGGGFLAMVPAGIVGLSTGILTYSLGLIPVLIAAEPGEAWLREEAERERQTAPKLKPDEFLIEIEPISALSKIDNRMSISKFMWAVTIFTGPEGYSKNHAAIVVEGLANLRFREGLANYLFNNIKVEIEEGAHFMYRAELNPPIESGIYYPGLYSSHLKDGVRRTELWMRSSDKVLEMLESIAIQKVQIREKLARGEEVKFNQYGVNSNYGGENQSGHSCFTWSRETVSILDIKLGEDSFEKIITWPRNFTRPFQDYENKPFSVQL